MTARDRRWRELQARNLNLWEQKHDLAGALQRRADAPIKPDRVQQPCDIGLFSDEASQLDLVEMLQDPTND